MKHMTAEIPSSNFFILIPVLILSSRVFQNFWENGNQSFLSTTFAPDRRETLSFAKKLFCPQAFKGG